MVNVIFLIYFNSLKLKKYDRRYTNFLTNFYYSKSLIVIYTLTTFGNSVTFI